MSYKDEARKYQLLNTAFELNLSKPTYEQIANLVFFDNDCTDAQRENNYTFLTNIDEAINRYVQNSEIDYKKTIRLMVALIAGVIMTVNAV